MNSSAHFRLKALCLAVASACAALQVEANPVNPTVVHGSATFSNSGNTLTVTNTPNAIINWQQFGINANETVRFVQQSAASAVLNRVTGADPSHILGTLQSNGRVFLINPAGIMFGQGAVVDVAGLVASTLNITDSDFLNGRLQFNADRAHPGSVVNTGQITTPNGGFVYLIAPQVENSGVITTPSGEAILAAGNSVELVDSADPALRVKVSAQSQDVNLSQMMTQSGGNIFNVLNSGRVSANTAVVGSNGKIVFKSAGDISTTTTSRVEARGSTEADGGTIIAFADGHGQYRGQFDATGKNGGLVETSGHTLDVAGASVIAAALNAIGKGGHWLLDPYNYTIGASEAASIVTALDTGTSVTVDTAVNNVSYGSTGAGAGDITVNADIITTAGSGATFTLQADNDIYINSGIDIRSTSSALHVVLNADHDGSGAGGIQMLSGSRIETQGGDIIMGGGLDPLTGYAVSAAGSGIDLNNVTLDSRGVGTDGTIQMHGVGSSTNNTAGVAINNSSINGGNGNLDIYGMGGAAAMGGRGVVVSNSTIQTSNGDLELDGTGGGGAGSFSDGVLINSGSVIQATGTGNVLLEGFGASGSGTNNAGVAIADAGTKVRSNSGYILTTAEGRSTGAGSYGLVMWNGSEMRSANGSVFVSADSLTGATIQLDNAGTLIRSDTQNVSLNAITGTVGMNNATVRAANSIAVSADTNLTVNAGWNLDANAAVLHSNADVNVTASPATMPSTSLTLSGDNVSVGGALTMGAGTNVNLIAQNDISIGQNITTGTLTATSSAGDINHTSGTINAENLVFDTTVGNIVINGGTINGINMDFDAGGDFKLLGGSDVIATGVSTHPWARISVDAVNIEVDAGSVIKSQSIDGAATVKLEASNQLSVNNATVEASSSAGASAYAHVHGFGRQGMTLNSATIKSQASNNTDEIMLFSQNMQILNSSIGTLNSTHIGLNFAPVLMLSDPSNFLSFLSTANVAIQGSSIGNANTQKLGFAGNDVDIVGSTLQGQKVYGMVGNILEVEGSGSNAAITAQDEMRLMVGRKILLESSGADAKINVTSSLGKLYFNFPQISSNGWEIDGVNNALTSTLSSNTGIFVGGAPAIEKTNFFVTYGGLNLPLRDILRRSKLDDDLEEFEMADAPDSEDFFAEPVEGEETPAPGQPKRSRKIRECS